MDLEQIRQAILEGDRKFGEGFRQGNSGAVANLYTDDAVLLPPNSGKIIGKDSIQAFWAGGMQMGIKDVLLTTEDVTIMGEFVCEIGNYKLTLQPEGQDTLEDRGKYLVIWKQEPEGTWKLHIDIWNTSTPA
jgi:uncharacterized protein (TIGR02246 family)